MKKVSLSVKVAECLRVAEEQGVNLNRADVMDSLLLISRSSDRQFISTLQDIRNHRPAEIATLNLAIAGMAVTCYTRLLLYTQRIIVQRHRPKSFLM
jgi:ketopantoate reductase